MAEKRTFDLGAIYERVVWVVVDVIAALLLLALVWQVGYLAYSMFGAIRSAASDAFKTITVEALSVFVFVELFMTFLQYIREHEVSVNRIADASIALVLREIWIVVYTGHAEWQTIVALGFLVLAIAGVRTLAVVYPKRMRVEEATERT